MFNSLYSPGLHVNFYLISPSLQIWTEPRGETFHRLLMGLRQMSGGAGVGAVTMSRDKVAPHHSPHWVSAEHALDSPLHCSPRPEWSTRGPRSRWRIMVLLRLRVQYLEGSNVQWEWSTLCHSATVPHAMGRNVLCWAHSQVSPPIKRGDSVLLKKNLDIFSWRFFFSNLIQPNPLWETFRFVSQCL